MRMVVVGSVFVDVKGIPEGPFRPDGRNAGRVETVHGGVARNVAEDLANAGGEPVFVGLADESGAGEDVIRHLREAGAATRFMRRVPGGMGTWLAVFDDRGEVAASVSRRPDLRPIAGILEAQGEEIFRGAGSVLLELDLEEETVERVCALAEKHGVPVFACVSNMTIAAERRAYLPRLACLVCNREELGILCPGPWEGLAPSALEARLPAVLGETGLPALAVTLGAHGAAWAEAGGGTGVCPALPAKVADVTGAGDAFFAGMSLGLTEGLDMGGACAAGARLAARVIEVTESVVPPLPPEERRI